MSNGLVGEPVGLVGGFFCGSVWGWDPSDRDHRGLLFVDLAEDYGPGGWFVAAATGGFVKAEGLERSGEGKEEQGRGDEDAEIKVDQAEVLQKRVRRRHYVLFLHKETKYDKLSLISFLRRPTWCLVSMLGPESLFSGGRE